MEANLNVSNEIKEIGSFIKQRIPKMDQFECTCVAEDIAELNFSPEKIRYICKQVISESTYTPRYKDFKPYLVKQDTRVNSGVMLDFWGLKCPSGQFRDELVKLYSLGYADYEGIVHKLNQHEWGSQWPIAEEMIARFGQMAKAKAVRKEKYCKQGVRGEIQKKFASLRRKLQSSRNDFYG